MDTATPSTAPDTTRFTIIVDGDLKAERRMWQEAADPRRYVYGGEEYDSYHFPRSERLVLDPDGLPVRLEILGQKLPWAAGEERFESEAGLARWITTVDAGERSVDGPAHDYAALHPVHDTGVLVRALLRQSSERLSLLPAGLDVKPIDLWLDVSGTTFTEWSVLSGWEAAFSELRAATEAALAQFRRGLARSLVPLARERPLAITGARLFDPETRASEGRTSGTDTVHVAPPTGNGETDRATFPRDVPAPHVMEIAVRVR